MASASFNININDKPSLRSEGGQSLLAALQAAHIFVPSACGGRGACGLCKVKVQQGAGPFTEKELRQLTPDEKQSQVRLACQIPVERDLTITIPEAYYQVREYKTEVIGLRNLTPDIKEIQLQLIEPAEITFEAGQYIQFRIPPYGPVKKLTFRSYSIASPPSQKNRIELEIRQVGHGIGSTYIFNYLKLRDRAVINGPYGDCVLCHAAQPEIILIAGGSGMAPMKSILLNIRDKKVPAKVRYFFGVRSIRDLFLVDLMRQLEQDLPDFTFIPALSEPQPDDRWIGETGRIADVVDRRLESNSRAEAYVCGSPAMINACLRVLAHKGLTPARIHYDRFV